MNIFSMAEVKREYAIKLNSKTSILLDHMLLLCLCYENRAYNKWKNEVYNNFIPHRLDVFKGSHKFPDLQFLRHNIYEHSTDPINIMAEVFAGSFKGFLKQKGITPTVDVDMNINAALERISSALNDICVVLANKHHITLDEYWSILDKNSI